MRDVIVLGGGVVGATITRALRAQGRDVLLLDTADPNSGSAASGGCLTPSKLTGLSSDEYSPILKTLEELYGAFEYFQPEFPGYKNNGGLSKLKSLTMKAVAGFVLGEGIPRLSTEAVLHTPGVTIKSSEIVERDSETPLVKYLGPSGHPYEERTKLLIVAAGEGTFALLPDVFKREDFGFKKGVSFRFNGTLEKSIIGYDPRRPYKQVWIHPFSPGVFWGCDGEAIKPESWGNKDYAGIAETRIKGYLPAEYQAQTPRRVYGIRVFAPTEVTRPCLISQVGPRAWVAVGAGKFGCYAAGYAANVMKEKS
jgi:hypothetical protein